MEKDEYLPLKIYTKAKRHTNTHYSVTVSLQGCRASLSSFIITLCVCTFMSLFFGDTWSANRAWGVCSCCLGVCEGRWGSDSCLMCVLSCRRPHARAPCAEAAGSSRLYLRSDQLWVRLELFWKFMISHVWTDCSLTAPMTNKPAGQYWATLPIASTVWSALWIIWALSKLTLSAQLESLNIWASLQLAPLGYSPFTLFSKDDEVIDTSLLDTKATRMGEVYASSYCSSKDLCGFSYMFTAVCMVETVLN